MKLFLALPLFMASLCPGLFAQAPASSSPQYFFAVGGEYSRYADPVTANGFMTFGARLSESLYSYNTIDLNATVASIRPGISYVFFNNGSTRLFALGQAGITTGSNTTLGNFTGGGGIQYDLGALFSKLKDKGIGFVGAARLNGVISGSVQPVFEFGLSKSFGQ